VTPSPHHHLPLILPLPAGPGLAGPPADARLSLPPGAPPEPVTGGGWTAVLSPARGILAVFTAEGEPMTGPVRVSPIGTAEAGEIRSTGPLLVGSGGWERRLTLPDGGVVVERGALLDSGPALAVEWSGPDGDPPPGLEVRVEHSGNPEAPPLGKEAVGGEEGTRGFLLLPAGSDPSRIPPRVLPIRAREMARYGRTPGPTLHLRGPGITLDQALPVLERTAAGIDRERQPSSPFILGVRDVTPVPAPGGALAELGLAALMAGNPLLGWRLLEELAHAPDRPHLPFLHLAGAFAAWTGDLARLVTLRPQVDQAAEALLPTGGMGTVDPPGGTPPPPAAWPGPLATLERLAQAVERAGGGWRESLLERRRRLTSHKADRSARPRRSLPVLGAAVPPPPDATDEPAPTLPPPAAFAPVLDPSQAPRRALHAARLIRTWVEGVLGVSPDVTYGRLELSPDLRHGPEWIEIRHLRAGEASVGLDYRHAGSACTLRLFQDGGSLPLNLVLHLSIPLEPPLVVTLGGERVEVSGDLMEGGARVSLQFPLDPERRIVIERA